MRIPALMIMLSLFAATSSFAQTGMVSSDNTTLAVKPKVSAEEIKSLAESERKAFAAEKAKMLLDHDQKRVIDTEAFRAQLESMDPEMRPDAIRAQNQSFYDEDLAFAENMHKKNVEFLKWRVSQNFEMTEDDRRAIYSLYEGDYISHPNFSEEHHTRNVEKLEEITNTPGLTVNEKIERYKAYREESR